MRNWSSTQRSPVPNHNIPHICNYASARLGVKAGLWPYSVETLIEHCHTCRGGGAKCVPIQTFQHLVTLFFGLIKRQRALECPDWYPLWQPHSYRADTIDTLFPCTGASQCSFAWQESTVCQETAESAKPCRWGWLKGGQSSTKSFLRHLWT